MAGSDTPTDELDVDLDRPAAGRARWGLFAAAAVVVLAVAVAVVVAITRGDDPEPGAGRGDRPAGEDATRLVGTRWTVVGIEAAAGAADAPAIATDGSLAVEISAERRISFTGCNGGSGTATLDGDRLVAPQIVSTMMACGGPDGEVRMAWDRWMAELLQGGVTVAGTGERVELRGAAGTVTLAADGPATPPPTTSGDPDDPVSSDDATSSFTPSGG